MAEYSKDKKSNDIVTETRQLYQDYSKARDLWARNAKEDKEFRLGKQWTEEQKNVLEGRGQAPIVVNRIHPAVETAKSMITANRPSFRCAAREDSDNRVARVMSELLSYMYDISDGRAVVRQVVDDYYVMGVGYMHVYQDPMMDMGKGEVCFHDLDPLDVYVDPNSQHRFFDDAENVIVSRLFTRDQAKKMWPFYKKAIDNASSEQDWNRPETGRKEANGSEIHFMEDTSFQSQRTDEYVRGYERYYKIHIDEYRIFEKFSGQEDLISQEDYEAYIQQPAWKIEGTIVVDEQAAQQLIQQLEMQREQQIQQEAMINSQSMEQLGYDASAELPETKIPPISVQQVTYADLIQEGAIEVVKVLSTKIKLCVIIGETKLYERILPTDRYPVVPFMNIHTRTPYPMSDVRIVKGMQEYINKTRSLIIAHATTSTNTKILVPEGSVDMKEFEEKWAQPGVAIPYDPTDGAPMPVQPTPLPNELYANEQTAKTDIDHQLGLYEMMMGNSQAAPQTYKATISLDEFGQRKIKSKLADIEGGLTRVAEVAIPMMQQLYTTEKIFRVVQPNNTTSEYMINKRMYDDKSQEIEVMNDITIGKYDVVVVAGSTLPTSRYAELEFYMDAYAKGLIDQQEVLKKTEIFDMEGVMQRTDMIGQLQSQLQQAMEQIKSLKGDLQTRDREAVNLRKKVEVEKFAAGLNKVKNKAEAAGTIYGKRLDDSMGTLRKDIAESIKKETDKGSPSKEAAKRRKK